MDLQERTAGRIRKTPLIKPYINTKQSIYINFLELLKIESYLERYQQRNNLTNKKNKIMKAKFSKQTETQKPSLFLQCFALLLAGVAILLIGAAIAATLINI